jgi:F-type H+-transporting ATPase subunit epsilon
MPDTPLHLTILTPARAVYDADVSSVVAPAFDGEVGILPGHAPFLALLGSGVLRATVSGGQTARFAVRGGFMQVNANKVAVLTPESLAAADIQPQALQAEQDKLDAEKPVKFEERDALAVRREWLKAKQKVDGRR